MSDKKRRDINFGELQDQCRSMRGQCERFENKPECLYSDFCEKNRFSVSGEKPCAWNLTDPPRFNEQQMALLRGFWEIGARVATRGTLGDVRFWTKDCKAEIATVEREFLFDDDDDGDIDLAELLAKDAT